VFIDIGNDTIIRTREVIIILDYELITASSFMERSLKRSEKNKEVIQIDEQVKSVVYMDDNIYLSPLSVSILKKRSNFASIINRLEDYTEKD